MACLTQDHLSDATQTAWPHLLRNDLQLQSDGCFLNGSPHLLICLVDSHCWEYILKQLPEPTL